MRPYGRSAIKKAYIGKTKYIVYSAAQTGAGIISTLDVRNETAKAKGTGGLLQVSSYLTGNSGGSWLVSSMLFQNFPDMFDLVLGNTDKGGQINGWFLEKDLVLPNGANPSDQRNQEYIGYVVFVILYISYIHLSTGVSSRALSLRVELGLTLR